MNRKVVGGSIAVLCFLGFPGASFQADAAGGVRAPKGAPAVTKVVVKFRTGTPANERAALHRANNHVVYKTIPQLDVHAVRIPRGKTAEQVIARYKNHPLVEYAEAEEYFPAAMLPNDPWYYREPTALWHLPVIHAPEAWDITIGSPDVIIAILDTGVYGAHPDLSAKMLPGWNVVRDNNDTHAFAPHGTAVAGVAAAESNNAIGVAAPAWGCKIMPIVVTENGWTGSVALAEGTLWAADHGARVINMSFEGSHTSIMFDAARYLQERGGVVVQSAGNSGTFSSEPDSLYILKVSGTDWYDNVWSQSVTGNDIDLAAPATDIGTTNSAGTYSFGTGTSFSAPIVSGVAALMLSVNPDLTGVQIQDILKQSADDLGPRGWDPGYGWGRVNAARAVQMARDAGPPAADTMPPSITVVDPTPGSLSGGLIAILADASDNTAVAQVDLYVDNSLISSDTVTPHEWAFDTKTLANGAHTLSAKAYDAAGNSAVSAGVSFTVDNAPPTASLIAPFSGETVSGTVTVSGSASDNLGLERVEFYRDGNVLLGTDSSAPYSISWDSASTSDGEHTLFAKACDLAGNETASAARSVTVGAAVDSTPPTVAINSPANGATVSGTVTVSGSASDNLGVERVEFYRDGNVLLGTDTSAPYACTWDTTTAAIGSHALFAMAYDRAGNEAASAPQTVSISEAVDTTPPTVAITGPTSGGDVSAKSSVTITAAASDDDAVAKVEFYVDGVLKSTDGTDPYAYAWKLPGVRGRTYRLLARAYDVSGNVASSGTVTVTSK